MIEGNTYKAKISTSLGTFEFEGSQEFVEQQIEKLINIEQSAPKKAEPAESEEATAKRVAPGKSNGAKKSYVEQPAMLPDLISGKDHVDSLRKFYAAKKPANHIETFAVLTLWLKSNLDLKDVSIDEMWTLCKVLQVKPPKVLMQTFRDGKSKKGYFAMAAGKTSRYYLTSYGETFVEHDLPRPVESK
jgi:hypothetical protein